jgi:FlaA1/EpsC-like NDP-sugar epimerase
MLQTFNTAQFISTFTGRPKSFFEKDLAQNRAKLAAEIDGKNVLVIGGAGTIGSSFIHAMLHFSPRKLVVVDISENGLTELVRDLRSSVGLNIPNELLTYPVSFGDPVFTKIFKTHGHFDIVACFAAHKHVRSEKDPFSIEAMVENNVFRTKSLLDLLLTAPPSHFFSVSTDKAANPVNVMGASKKLMEDVILAYSKKLNVTTARFANVAFSNGSLLAGFFDRLSKKQPLSVPLGIRRFFVSPQESGELCLLACVLGQSGDIFFPKLGEDTMVTFDLIAEKFITAFGFGLDKCTTEEEARQKATKLGENPTHWPVYFFNSDTSGEKHFEEFFTESEKKDLRKFKALGIVKTRNRKSIADISKSIKRLKTLFLQENLEKSAIVACISEIVSGFEHLETGKSLDQKM